MPDRTVSHSTRHDRLLADLADDLHPVRPLPSPAARASLWLGAAGLFGLLLAAGFDTSGFLLRMHVPDLALAAIGAVLTAAASAFAAFATSVPGRSSGWALLPVPPLVLWIGASGLGCLRDWIAPGVEGPGAHTVTGCFSFLICTSVPLSALIVVMLRRACPLRPNLTAALGGLAVAAAAAALLMPVHPHDATATDLLIHLAAVAIVIALNALAGGRLLGRD